jgi:hypothetical protein
VNFATRRFFPHFVLRSQDFDKEYLAQVIPAAQAAIQKREKPGVRIQNSIEMTRIKIPLSDDRIDRRDSARDPGPELGAEFYA